MDIHTNIHTYIHTYIHIYIYIYIHIPVDVRYRFTDCLFLSRYLSLSLSLTIPGVRKRMRFLTSLLYFMVLAGIVMLAVANQQLGRIGIFHDGLIKKIYQEDLMGFNGI